MMHCFTRLWIVGPALVLTACGVSAAPTGAGTLPGTAMIATSAAPALRPPTSYATPIPPTAAGEQPATSATDTGSDVVGATVGPTATRGNTPTPLKSPTTITATDDGQRVQLAA